MAKHQVHLSLLLLGLCCLAILLGGAVDQTVAQTVVREHREPGAAAQWSVGGPVVSDSPNQLYNVARRQLLSARSSNLVWEDMRPGSELVMLENCTRGGEIIYSSDRVAIRFFESRSDLRFLTRSLTFSYARVCDFRLIPSGGGLVAAGSGDGKFAIYSIDANRYLVYTGVPLWGGLGLQLQQTVSGRPPLPNVAARADFVPIELFSPSAHSAMQDFRRCT